MEKILYVLMALLLLFFSAEAARTTRRKAEETAVLLSQAAELAREAGYGYEKLSTVLVDGAVVCNIAGVKSLVPGVKVGVECNIGGKVRRAYGKTDESGEFSIDLPSRLHANPKLEEDCAVGVLRIPKRSSLACNMAMGRRFEPIKLSSVQEGTRVYSVGTLTLSYGAKSLKKLNGRARIELTKKT